MTVLVGCTAPNPSPESEPTPSPSPVPTSSSRSDSLLEAHNLYRFEVGVPPLEWSESLANSSQAWADRLAATNTFAHSDSNEYGENLWKGTAGAYSLADMVKFWGDEKQYFIPDTAFPNLSTTGNWADVGHYTQIIWRDTTEVGCGLATGNGQDVLVCRYSPPGNYQGQKPF
ncbi:SCP-like extracellular [Phormidium tenue NIES-30]|uniref:SCP-like extracellular n=1 Tax=Phormidium tenue NIES-30 TaxID=549789 RepID=A0A1U7JBX8_9CYAN|nr:SCP-like extracellular [Phormidium tenue NIES-30]